MINFVTAMKPTISINLMIVVLACIAQACAGNGSSAQTADRDNIHTSKTETSMETNQLYLHVNGHTLTVDLQDNSSVHALVDYLKSGGITVAMRDYAHFEKFGELPRSFPRNDERITTGAGDVILSEGNLLVIYYDRNSWNFTRIGKIRDIGQAELKQILGDGDVSVTVSLTANQ